MAPMMRMAPLPPPAAVPASSPPPLRTSVGSSSPFHALPFLPLSLPHPALTPTAAPQTDLDWVGHATDYEWTPSRAKESGNKNSKPPAIVNIGDNWAPAKQSDADKVGKERDKTETAIKALMRASILRAHTGQTTFDRKVALGVLKARDVESSKLKCANAARDPLAAYLALLCHPHPPLFPPLPTPPSASCSPMPTRDSTS